MKRLFTVLLCAMVVAASFACGEDKGKVSKRAQAKAPTQAQKKASAKRQVKQDREGECNKQASLRNLKSEERKRFISSCLRG